MLAAERERRFGETALTFYRRRGGRDDDGRGLPRLVRPDHERPPRRHRAGPPRVFDRVVVGVLANPRKQPLLSVDDRVAVIRGGARARPASPPTGSTVETFDGLTVDFCRRGRRRVHRPRPAGDQRLRDRDAARPQQPAARPRRRHGVLHDRGRARLRRLVASSRRSRRSAATCRRWSRPRCRRRALRRAAGRALIPRDGPVRPRAIDLAAVDRSTASGGPSDRHHLPRRAPRVAHRERQEAAPDEQRRRRPGGRARPHRRAPRRRARGGPRGEADQLRGRADHREGPGGGGADRRPGPGAGRVPDRRARPDPAGRGREPADHRARPRPTPRTSAAAPTSTPSTSSSGSRATSSRPSRASRRASTLLDARRADLRADEQNGTERPTTGWPTTSATSSTTTRRRQLAGDAGDRGPGPSPTRRSSGTSPGSSATSPARLATTTIAGVDDRPRRRPPPGRPDRGPRPPRPDEPRPARRRRPHDVARGRVRPLPARHRGPDRRSRSRKRPCPSIDIHTGAAIRLGARRGRRAVSA